MTPPLPLPQSQSPPVSQSRRPKRGPGRPPKPKRDHAVTLTLSLPNAAFVKHLKRVAKKNGHKSPSALIIATFPVNPVNNVNPVTTP